MELLNQNHVHLWLVRLSGDIAGCESVLSNEESLRAKRFVRKADQEKFILGKAVTRKILSRYLGCAPDAIQFDIGLHGKPFVRHAQLQFNVSHAGDFLLLGLSSERHIGVDIEFQKKNVDCLALSKRFFSISEYEAIAAASDPVAAFYRCWTCKEAFIKATGFGLSFGLSDFVVDVDRGALLSVRREDFLARDFVLRTITTEIPDYFAAFVVQGSVEQVKFFRKNNGFC